MRLCWFTSAELCETKTNLVFFLLRLLPEPATISQNPVPPANNGRHHHHHIRSPRQAPLREPGSCELRAGARVRAGSPRCARGEIPSHFMLGWHFVGRWMLPPRSLCAAAGAEVWGGCQAMATPCLDRAWPVWLQPLTAGLLVTSPSAHGLARRSQTGSSLFFLFSWTRRKPGKRAGIPDLPWEQPNIVCMVMKGTKPQTHRALSPGKPGHTKAGCVIGRTGRGQRQCAEEITSSNPQRRARCGSWEDQALPFILFFMAMSLQLIWRVCVNMVAQQPDLFQTKYCNTWRAFVISVFCYTHKVKMGTFAQLVLVFASSWYFLKIKWLLLCSVLKFKRSLIFLFAMWFSLLLRSKVEKWIHILYTLDTISTWTISICWGQVQLLWKFCFSQKSISWQPGIVSLWRKKHGCHGKLWSWREKQVFLAIRGLVSLYHEGKQQACPCLETRAELGHGVLSSWRISAVGLFHHTSARAEVF